jgi:hypothetical protein
MTHPILFERLKCESESENIKKRSWGMFPSLQHFGVEGRVGALKWGLERATNESIIHMDLQKPNNKLVNA